MPDAHISSQAVIHIEEFENGDVNIYCDLVPEITEAQKEGEEELPYSHFVAGLVLNAIEAVVSQGDEPVS